MNYTQTSKFSSNLAISSLLIYSKYVKMKKINEFSVQELTEILDKNSLFIGKLTGNSASLQNSQIIKITYSERHTQ